MRKGRLYTNEYSIILKWADAKPEVTDKGLVFKARWQHRLTGVMWIPLTLHKDGKITVRFSYGSFDNKFYWPTIPAKSIKQAAVKVLDRIIQTIEKLEEEDEQNESAA